MKIYIMTDLEGISGVRRMEDVMPPGARYEHARSYLGGDLNAAIAGAFEGGATEVWVCDSHAGGGNLPLEKMDPRAKYCEGGGNTHMLAGLDSSFAGLFQVGMHAMAGTRNAFLDHTRNSGKVFQYTLNGVPYGEIGHAVILAGGVGVAQLLVTGDKAACAEALALTPNIVTVSVKEAYAREKVVCLQPQRAQELIRAGARQAMGLAGKLKPLVLKPPFDARLTWYRSDYADQACERNPRLERVDARTIRYVTEDVNEIQCVFV